MPDQTLIQDYLAALSRFEAGDNLSKFFHAQFEQKEFPNALTPQTAVRDVAATLQGAERGKAILSEQLFDLQTYIVGDKDRAVAEVIWTGTLKIDLASLRAGDQMRAHFACIFEFKDGLIYRQRNYDCFDRF